MIDSAHGGPRANLKGWFLSFRGLGCAVQAWEGHGPVPRDAAAGGETRRPNLQHPHVCQRPGKAPGEGAGEWGPVGPFSTPGWASQVLNMRLY